MRWIATLALSLVLTGAATAAGSDEQYLDIYNEILQANTLEQGGQGNAAALRYLQAQTDLQKLHTDHPTWNPDIVKFRLDYLAEKLQALAKFLPTTNAPAAATAAVRPSAPGQLAVSGQSDVASLQQQNAGYQEQIRSLAGVNAELEGKLKEALSVQPAAASPDELAKAEAKITALQKERDLVAVALEQEKAASTNAIAEAVSETEKKFQTELGDARKELETLKAQRAAEAEESAANAKKLQEQVARLTDASAESEKILASVTRELELLKGVQPSGAQVADSGKQVPEAGDQLKQAMTEISADETEIARLKDAVADAEKKAAAASSELEALKAAHPAETTTAEGAKQAPESADQLKQALAQISTDETEITRLKDAVADSEKKLAAANGELDSLKAGHPAEGTVPDSTKALMAERDKLKDELDARSKDLADAETHHNEEILDLRTQLQRAEQRRDDLEKQLAAASGQVPKETNPGTTGTPAESPAASDKLEQLQAKIAVLEANSVPYTQEELALLQPPPADANAESANPPPKSRHVHSNKDLPPGSGALWQEGMDATMSRNFETAERKFSEVLKQDPTNVYVLAYLANAQFAAGHLDRCEKSVQQALSVEPDDAGSLYLLGLLRYRQNSLDEALDALSLAAKNNPTNSATQNFLGCVLADKGLRHDAETALRKALDIDPNYAEAHFNLAVVYYGNQPQSLELARWHYKKAMELGQPKDERSEKLGKLLGLAP